ncbi:MAG: transporter substrate-binding domain-containing protein [Christensenellales bacterium]|nr:transporter substrate-binding domain-containing protein [Christensenellales bacterium]
MKRVISVILMVAAMFSPMGLSNGHFGWAELSALCEEESIPMAEGRLKAGGKNRVVGKIAGDNDAELHFQHLTERHPEEINTQVNLEIREFATLESLLMALNRGDITMASMNESTAEYVLAQNPEYQIMTLPTSSQKMAYAMMFRRADDGIFADVNRAIREMKEDGTMDDLIRDYLEGFISGEAASAQEPLPEFAGAPVVRVAVSGDFPPMDLIHAGGEPVGFNVAMLSEIARREHINFQLIVVEAPSRMVALSTGKVDALFWANGSYCVEHDFSAFREREDMLITDFYYVDDIVRLFRAE